MTAIARSRRTPPLRGRSLVVIVALAVALGAAIAVAWPSSHARTPPNARASRRRTRSAGRAPLVIVAARPPVRPPRRPLRLPLRLDGGTVELPILMYHRIDELTAGMPALTRGLTVSPSVFAGQMAWIEAHRFHTVTQLQVWNALMHGRPLPPRPVLITFDDAYRDVVRYAAPVIRRDHAHATAYVITDRLSHGRVTPWMRWNQLPLLEHDGFDIGSHTVSHADLVAVGATDARFELRASRFALERYLHTQVQWLAYPYGKVDSRIERLAEQAGYVLGVTTEGGATQSASAPLLLHREEVTGTMGVEGLASLLEASEHA